MNSDQAWEFVKGHGTQNDFVILTDPAAELDLPTEVVAAICDRQRGIGADGLLRVARAGALVAAGTLAALPAGVSPDDWFMDYRNADGSIAEMCGNGVRVFAHYVRATGLAGTDEFTVGSRAGARPVIVHSFDTQDADVSVQMGPARLGVDSSVTIGSDLYRGIAVDVGNPHLACVVPGLDADALAAVDFGTGVQIDSQVFPHGTNVELLTVPTEADGRLHARMRVFERGVGETRSCGTGLVAAAAAGFAHRGESTGEITIDVPGGRVQIQILPDDAWLRGPSALVADGRFRPGWTATAIPAPEVTAGAVGD
ncbi:diaminopimelate epimerase [Gordonia desulfuricans]|uniref:Diaminopimelate epimerase n=2 Tax=Gordonia desulfuricans TaxID=89051 RepID=A0A7K3LMF9_9ACTN|nr:diaminopimelate epimerase [Gordonia sp. NB41Y]KOY49884.1 diaminopimelate epimerase [Gordonia sp. NB41Y]NDK89446.1 diaminopimelate epimerase [Gordonia desulfuricans]WLP91104.1 diaminopimelate epimerase [Gordonia sp. NB41Y]